MEVDSGACSLGSAEGGGEFLLLSSAFVSVNYFFLWSRERAVERNGEGGRGRENEVNERERSASFCSPSLFFPALFLALPWAASCRPHSLIPSLLTLERTSQNILSKPADERQRKQHQQQHRDED